MLSQLAGKKTYIVAFLTFVFAGLGWILGYLPQESVWQLMATALVGVGIRHGMAQPK